MWYWKSSGAFENIFWKICSLETRAVLIEIFMLCWNLPSGPKHHGWLKKNSAFPEGDKQFCWWFRANLSKAKADMVQIYKEMELEMDCLTSRRLSQKFAAKNVSFLHQSLSIFQGWSLTFTWWLGKINVQKKYLMCQIQIKMLKQHATPNPSQFFFNFCIILHCHET